MANVKFTDLPNLGNITANTIVPVVDSNVNYTVTATQLQTFVNTGNITANTVSATGNITGNYFIGNGSQLTGIVSSYGNANVADYLPIYTGNIAANVISATGNIAGSYFLGNGSQLTGLPATYGNANVAAYLATNTGNITANTISASGNVTGAFILGDGSQLTNLPSLNYNNSNVVTLLAAFGSNVITTTGNIQASYFAGDGSLLTNLPSGILSGNLTGNIAGNGFGISNVVTLTSTGAVSAAGNVSGANIVGTHFGNGANLTGIPTSIQAGNGISVNSSTGAVTITNNNPTPYTNANVAAYLPTYTGNLNPNVLTANAAVIGGTLTVGSTSANLTVNFGSAAMLIRNTDSAGGGLIIQAGLINSSNIPLRIRNANGIEVANVSIGGQIQTASTISAAGNISTAGFISAVGNVIVGGTANIGPYIERTTTGLTTSTSFTPVMSVGPVQRVTANNNFTLTAPTGMIQGQSITLIIVQDATGSRVMTPNAAYKFAYGLKTLSTAANAIDMMSIFYDGTDYLCNLVKGYTT